MQVRDQVPRPPKIKHKYPEMSEAERKLAEADAYLRKLSSKPSKPQVRFDNDDPQLS